MNESSQTGAPSCAASQSPGPSSTDPAEVGEGDAGRPSAEVLCRRVIAILDENLPDGRTVRQLRELFDMPDPHPRPLTSLDARRWPVLRAADEVHDPRD